MLYKIKRSVGVFLLFGLLQLAMMAPNASLVHLTSNGDCGVALCYLIQGGLALEEGQFPIRTAPLEINGMGAPVYQFYSQLPSMVGGLVYKTISPNNPFRAFLFLAWLTTTCGAYFIYKTAVLLTRSTEAAIIAGFIYLSAPYLLVTLFSRGAYSEYLAQGVLPITLYYSLKCYYSSNYYSIIPCGIAWFLLIGTHLITFIYFTIFFAIVLLAQHPFQIKTISRLIKLSSGYILGVLLSLYYLAPIVLLENINVKKNLDKPYTWSWLVPISTLLAPTSIAPVPLPNTSFSTPNLNLEVGWPLLISFGSVVWYYFFRRQTVVLNNFGRIQYKRNWAVALAACFFVAFMFVWSPIDYWAFLPEKFRVVQFSYRNLTHCAWLGALLSAYAITLLCGRNLGAKHVVLAIAITGIYAAPFLPTLPEGAQIADVVRSPILGTSTMMYIYAPTPAEIVPMSASAYPVGKNRSRFTRRHGKIVGTVAISEGYDQIELPALYYPGLLEVKMDGKDIPYVCAQTGDNPAVLVHTSPGIHRFEIEFTGYSWANWIALLSWFGILSAWAVRAGSLIIKSRMRHQSLAVR